MRSLGSLTPSYGVTLFIAVFSATLLLTQRALEYKLDRKRRSSLTGHKSANSSPATGDSPPSTLSLRGQRALQPVLPYFPLFIECLMDPASTRNQSGKIALCVAENKQVAHHLAPKLASSFATALNNPSAFTYNDMLGLPELREAAASLFTRLFAKNAFTVPSEAVVVGSGAAGLLTHLFTLLTPERAGVLIPAPYYAAFENDMKVLANCTPVSCPCTDPYAGPTNEDLDKAFEAAERDGVGVEMLLLTNPNNPLGVCYEGERLRGMIEWARGRGLQVIVDEIYALSVYRPSPVPFTSVLSLLGVEGMGNDVHMIWALSKDFGGSGLRTGFCVTNNQELLKALGNVNCFSCVPHPLQLVIADTFSDSAFIDDYLIKSNAALLTCYNITVAALDSLSLPYSEAYAGMFLWVDFSSLLPELSWEGEEAITQVLYDDAGIVLTPGAAQHAYSPGQYRLCFAWNDIEVLKMAMDRLGVVVDNIRERGWVDLEVEERDDVTTSGVRRRGSSYAGE